jgi:hypothetical protein
MEATVETKFDSPEILNGIPGINWNGYEPSGGQGWHDEYVNSLRPKIDGSLVELKATAAGYEKERTRLASLGKCAKEAQRLCERIQSIVADSGAACLDPGVQEWLAATARLAGQSFSVPARDAEGFRLISEDIKFLSAFKEYVEADFALDRVLFALYQVDARYKMKLFRCALRMCREIDVSRAVIRNSRSLLLKYFAVGGFSDFFELMDNAYGRLSVGLRKLKKLVDRQGVSALDATEFAGRDLKAEARRLFAGYAA